MWDIALGDGAVEAGLSVRADAPFPDLNIAQLPGKFFRSICGRATNNAISAVFSANVWRFEGLGESLRRDCSASYPWFSRGVLVT